MRPVAIVDMSLEWALTKYYAGEDKISFHQMNILISGSIIVKIYQGSDPT